MEQDGQSATHDVQFSPMSHVLLPQQVPQSAGQVEHVSGASHMVSPHCTPPVLVVVPVAVLVLVLVPVAVLVLVPPPAFEVLPVAPPPDPGGPSPPSAQPDAKASVTALANIHRAGVR